MSRTLARLVTGFARLITLPTSERQRARVYARIKDHFDRAVVHTLATRHGELRFYTNRGAAAASALHTFQDDEPETIAWIDDHVKSGEVVWDVGANIGLYSCYAAKAGARVVAFEPSGLNFGLLVAHLELNGLGASVDPYCLALNGTSEATELFTSGFEPGHAFNSIGSPQSQFSTFEPKFRQAILGFAADDLVERFGLPSPDHLKVDVDGAEIPILRGAVNILGRVKTLILEIEGKNRDVFDDEIAPLLQSSGLSHAGSWEDGARNQLFTRA